MKEQRPPNIQIQELFLVKADWERTFMGMIRRETDESDNEIIYGKVTVQEGYILCAASTEEDLGSKLDTICKLKLDCGLHDSLPPRIKILNAIFFLN
jgi:hypothetical protein